MKIDGRKIAQEILAGLKIKPVPEKTLAAVLVGDDSASAVFVTEKEKVAKQLGIDFRRYQFPSYITKDDLKNEIEKLVRDESIGGIIVQLPLPEQIGRYEILNAIPKEKDVDALGAEAIGAFYNESGAILPPAVGTVAEILRVMNYESRIKEMRTVVAGRELLVGKPVALWLMKRVKELYVLGRESDLAVLAQADLVVSGVGEAHLIRPEMLKDGAGVIDFGYGKWQMADGKWRMAGDLDDTQFASGDSPLAFYTPTPGGTGPILVAKLLENFFRLCEISIGHN